MTGWKITGIIATVVIVLSLPLYVLKQKHISLPSKAKPAAQIAEFVGSAECRDCHRIEYDKWKGSHHDQSMDTATEDTVRGDFGDAVFEIHGVASRFYRRDGRFFVHTQGPEGRMGDFEITHTFGYYPLQQYLVPFDGGRLQCLPIAWDVNQKKWYHLYPDQPLDPQDWLYWTNAGQNWNGMCAECHSTNLQKNYNPQTDTYRSTWSEIDVSCEACHGPGSLHVAWAQMPDMARPETENYELLIKTAAMTPLQQVELCAPCHARRSSLQDNAHASLNFLDGFVPRLLSQGLYFADGQILEEVYVYGSFLQSKMFHRDVHCSDCHDVHSIKRIKNGNDLCLQCHRADIYDTKDHHFHKKKGEQGEPIKDSAGMILFDVGSGARCEQCHMPGRNYMGIDYRPDHSFRVPRPDLSQTIGVPNACNRCHFDKTDQWSVDHVMKWYGQKHKPHYGTILYAGRKGLPENDKDLIRLAEDRLFPAIVRATALSLLSRYPGQPSIDALARALSDEQALVRHSAVRNLVLPDPGTRLQLVAPLLYDPVKAVRIEAARSLAEIPPEKLSGAIQKVHQSVLDEYRRAMEYTADFASSRHNLGNLYSNLGQFEKAAHSYKKAIEIDGLFYPAKVNLAMLYNQKGRNKEAEKLLREVVQAHPALHEVKYSLGLLLAEEKKYEEAAVFLAAAARGMPERARVHYNLGLLLAQLQHDRQAEMALLQALEIEPGNMNFLYAMADFYLKRNRMTEAKLIAEQMIAKHPQNKLGSDLLNFINGRQPR